MLPIDYFSRSKADGEVGMKIKRSILERVGLFLLKIKITGPSKSCFVELSEDNIFDSPLAQERCRDEANEPP